VEVLLDVVRLQLLGYPVLFVRDFTRSLAEATAEEDGHGSVEKGNTSLSIL